MDKIGSIYIPKFNEPKISPKRKGLVPTTVEELGHPQAIGGYVIIETHARKPGETYETDSGLIAVEDKGEIPVIGKIISVGDKVPDHIKEGYIVILPNMHMQNVPDPRVAVGLMKPSNPEARTMVMCQFGVLGAIFVPEADVAADGK